VAGKLIHEVMENAPASLTQLELLVLIALADGARDADRSTRGASSSVAVIAYKTRATEGSVRNVLSRLAARALIKPTGPRTQRGRAQNYYLTPLTPYHREL